MGRAKGQVGQAAAGLHLIALDTVVPRQSHGALGPAQLAWLAGQLGQCRDEPVLLFMHHPPLPTGIEAMDACSLLEGGDELAALVRAHGRVQGILCGHLHRPVQMQFGGASLHVAPSVSHQIALDLRPGAALHAQLGTDLHHCLLKLPASEGRARARLFAAGAVLRPSGSISTAPGSIPAATSCSVTMKR